MTVTCPRCSSKNVRMSLWQWPDLLHRLILRRAYRCRDCRSRFRTFCWIF